MNKKLDHSPAALGLKIASRLEEKKAERKPLYLRVKILPESPKNEFAEKLEDETYKIRVAAPPVDGKANKELCRFLKKELKASEVMIISGGRERVKLVKIVA